MGGVEKRDWWIRKGSVSIRSETWYFPLFTRLIDMSVVNAYKIYTFFQNGRRSLTCSDLLHWPAFFKLLEIPRKRAHHSGSFFLADYEYLNYFFPARPDIPNSMSNF